MGLAELHNIVDHFTIAFVVFGILSDFYGRMTRNEHAKAFAWTSLRLGLAFLVLSALTGFVSEAKVTIDTTASPVTNYHKVVGIIAFAVGIAAVILRVSAKQSFEEPARAALRGAYVALEAVLLVLLAFSMYLGMELVFSHGVGVRPYQQLIQTLPTAPSAPADTATTPAVSPAPSSTSTPPPADSNAK